MWAIKNNTHKLYMSFLYLCSCTCTGDVRRVYPRLHQGHRAAPTLPEGRHEAGRNLREDRKTGRGTRWLPEDFGAWSGTAFGPGGLFSEQRLYVNGFQSLVQICVKKSYFPRCKMECMHLDYIQTIEITQMSKKQKEDCNFVWG